MDILLTVRYEDGMFVVVDHRCVGTAWICLRDTVATDKIGEILAEFQKEQWRKQEGKKCDT